MSGRPLAVVLASGGLDSCVTATIAAQTHDLALLHASYGQRTAARERRAFFDVAEALRVPDARRRTLELSFLAEIGGSALTDRTLAVPEGLGGAGIPITYVPFRNAHLIAAAVSWAEVLGANDIYYGAVEADSSGYPDCRESFVKALEYAIQLGTAAGERMRLHAPLVQMSKPQIVRRGLELAAPLHATWSCYQAEEAACGRCESCLLRLAGFRGAGVEDPIRYAAS